LGNNISEFMYEGEKYPPLQFSEMLKLSGIFKINFE